MQHIFKTVGPFLQPLPTKANATCFHYYSKTFGTVVNSRQSQLPNGDLVPNAQCIELPYKLDLNELQEAFNTIDTESNYNIMDHSAMTMQKYANQYITPLHLVINAFKLSQNAKDFSFQSTLALCSGYMESKSLIFAKTYDGQLYNNHYFPLYMIRDKAISTTAFKLIELTHLDQFTDIIAGLQNILYNGQIKTPAFRSEWFKVDKPSGKLCSQKQLDQTVGHLHNHLFQIVRCSGFVDKICEKLYSEPDSLPLESFQKNEIILQILRDYSLQHLPKDRSTISPFLLKSNILDISANSKDPVNMLKSKKLDELIKLFPDQNPSLATDQFDEMGLNAFDPVEESRVKFHSNAYVIDPYNVHESDDAISVVPTSSGDEVTIHIADPASLMVKDHPIINMAARRVSTLYLTEQSYPIMPKQLINKRLCLMAPKSSNSLWSAPQPQINALSFQFTLTKDNLITNFKIFPSALMSVVKTNYSILDAIFDRKNKTTRVLKAWTTNEFKKWIEPAENNFKDDKINVDEINLLYSVANRLNTALNIEKSNNISLDCSSLQIEAPSEAMFMVQCYMVQCNLLAAQYAKDNKLDILYLKTDTEHVANASQLSIVPGIHQYFKKEYTSCTSPLRKFSDVIYHFQYYANRYDLKHLQFSKEWLSRYSHYCNTQLKRIKKASTKNQQFYKKFILSQHPPQRFKIVKNNFGFYAIPELQLTVDLKEDYPSEFTATYTPQPFEQFDVVTDVQ